MIDAASVGFPGGAAVFFRCSVCHLAVGKNREGGEMPSRAQRCMGVQSDLGLSGIYPLELRFREGAGQETLSQKTGLKSLSRCVDSTVSLLP